MDSGDCPDFVDCSAYGLEKDYKIKVTITLFGREKMHADLGIKILDDLSDKLKDKANVEKNYGANETQKFIILTAIK